MKRLIKAFKIMFDYIAIILMVIIVCGGIAWLVAHFWPWSMAVVGFLLVFGVCWEQAGEVNHPDEPDYPI